MKLKPSFVIRKVGGRTLAVAVGEISKTFHGMITLNGSGELIMKRLASETTEDEIVNAILDEYEIDRETAARDVAAFVGKLREQNLLQE